MKRFFVWLLVPATVCVGLVFVSAENAEAGRRFRRARERQYYRAPAQQTEARVKVDVPRAGVGVRVGPGVKVRAPAGVGVRVGPGVKVRAPAGVDVRVGPGGRGVRVRVGGFFSGGWGW